jgi:hypothetical protein
MVEFINNLLTLSIPGVWLISEMFVHTNLDIYIFIENQKQCEI